MSPDDEARLWSKIDAEGPSWLWTGTISRKGYGRFSLKHRMYRAHRLVWERLVGPIPDGLTIDHLCRVRHCVNPDHLEPVTMAENSRRGQSGKNLGRMQAAKTHCPQGHPYDETNTRFQRRRSGRHQRVCHACNMEQQRRRRQRKRVLA